MSFLGKEVRMNRLLSKRDGRYLGITVDHAMARGVMRGLDTIEDTLAKLVAGEPDALTMHKGLAEKCYAKHAGKIPLVVKCSTFSPYQPDLDTVVGDVEEAVRLGADAVSVGCIVCGDTQPAQVAALGKMAKDAASFGMPLVAHIYPRGNQIAKDCYYKAEYVMYAARLGAELGVDIVKTSYTGDPESFAKVVQACPAKVVVAGGSPGKDLEHYFQMAYDVVDAGAIGVTFGRFVFQYGDPASLIKAISSIIHGKNSVKEALDLLAYLENEKK
ncbi:class I fructose-bisphosphate aldolase [Sporomusa acidovorans]|uniref:2-amino-4, 5-dihydroxy-6-oxo-7-(Phosphonooxy)heptanoate synthase n=1 Tax=Sporomusa acidovorans (strain ATCC 49682 / DSM 3132 / Mol) TaxID=1123286 RepID=A0ABZ3J9J0_SPOA4|nr:2-amino-3,7-dideoxy-D-threo-hept-6-ulosonate synthase [Sporomusa acidovorans]OZC16151.1 2-amino-4,5-dihydroxy-6-oxo-7-(phosphonooxy)heptanoate synthase [Sporomusa acidovorans DSM 3132]SDE29179.1 fructose-bisphosphate aldolase, class I [Sporomusa acidovorans]